MADPIKGLQTQLVNIEKRTGKTIAELEAVLKASGLTKHGEMVQYLKSEQAMGHGDANTLVHHYLSEGKIVSEEVAEDYLDAIYQGPKAALRPIHEALLLAIAPLGDYETAPKKAYVSLRRKKQFAMIGPATNTRIELGLNMKGVEPTERLTEVAPGGMCNYKVKLTEVAEIDEEVIAWVRLAYDSAG